MAVCGGDLTFVLAGLGVGVGTGVAPLVARWARESGAVVVGLATVPFRAERNRQVVAHRAIPALREACNSLVVLENNRLLARAPDLPLEQAFAVMDHVSGELIREISVALLEPSVVPLHFPDVSEILREGGTSTLLLGQGDVREPQGIVDTAFASSLVEADCRGAAGAVIHLTSGADLPIVAAHRIVADFAERLRPGARVAFGVRSSPEFEGGMRLVTILTGVRAPSVVPEASPIGGSISPSPEVE